jgi:isopenicillin N synthase-like dioxygenase
MRDAVVATVDFAQPDAATRFVQSLHTCGFAVVINHPIPAGLVSAICDEWLVFFGTDRKHAYRHGENSPSGYYPFEEAPASRAFSRDRKEFFHIYRDGTYPIEVSDAAIRYFRQARELGITLAGWLDKYTPPEISGSFSMPLADMLTRSETSVLRIQHYFPVVNRETAGGLRAVAHTDINLLTILPAPTSGGLQLRDLATQGWQDIPCDEGSLIINGGEMLDAASGGYFPAAEHRVVNPDSDAESGSRFSLPLFLAPPDDVEVKPGCTASELRKARVEELARKGWNVVAGGESKDAHG